MNMCVYWVNPIGLGTANMEANVGISELGSNALEAGISIIEATIEKAKIIAIVLALFLFLANFMIFFLLPIYICKILQTVSCFS